jgi:hypothetical protein
MKRTFQHRFGGGVTCELTIDSENLTAGKTHIVACVWSGSGPKLRHVAEYKRWMHSINETVAAETGLPIAHCFLEPNGSVEMWIYSQAKQPR